MTKTSSKPAESRLESDRRPDGKFAPGNRANPKGRIPGSRNKATLAAQALLDGEVENLTRKAVELALEGDTTALRLCLERILPARKEAALIPLDLPQVEGAADLPQLSLILWQPGGLLRARDRPLRRWPTPMPRLLKLRNWSNV